MALFACLSFCLYLFKLTCKLEMNIRKHRLGSVPLEASVLSLGSSVLSNIGRGKENSRLEQSSKGIVDYSVSFSISISAVPVHASLQVLSQAAKKNASMPPVV